MKASAAVVIASLFAEDSPGPRVDRQDGIVAAALGVDIVGPANRGCEVVPDCRASVGLAGWSWLELREGGAHGADRVGVGEGADRGGGGEIIVGGGRIRGSAVPDQEPCLQQPKGQRC